MTTASFSNPANTPVAPLPSTPAWARYGFLAIAGATTAAAPWMLGSEPLGSQWILLYGAAATFIAGVVLRIVAKPSPGARAAWRMERWVLLLGLLFLGLILAQALNPSHRVVMEGNLWKLVPTGTLKMGPHGLDAPFDYVAGDYLPFKNSWRYLMIFSVAWLFATGLALGLVERADVRRWAMMVGVNGVVLGLVCIVHRAMGERMTLWHFGNTFDFTGSPVFFYKNHNGAYLAASMALVLGLADSAEIPRARRLWEIGALVLWTATVLVNSRVATACATVWGVVYLVRWWRSSRRKADAQHRVQKWVRGLSIAATLALVALVLGTTGAEKSLRRFAPLLNSPVDFLRGGDFRVMLREVGFHMWKGSPMWGWGGGSYLYLFNTYHRNVPELARHMYREQPNLNRFFGPTANCDWIEFLVEYGVVGGSLLLLMFTVPLITWWKWEGREHGLSIFLVLGAVGIVLHANFDYILRNPAILVLGVGAMLAALRLAVPRILARRKHY
jgi:hypothetical protein